MVVGLTMYNHDNLIVYEYLSIIWTWTNRFGCVYKSCDRVSVRTGITINRMMLECTRNPITYLHIVKQLTARPPLFTFPFILCVKFKQISLICIYDSMHSIVLTEFIHRMPWLNGCASMQSLHSVNSIEDSRISFTI